MSEQPSTIHVRAARSDDVELLFDAIERLARYERAPDAVTGSVEQLRTALFGSDPVAEALVAELGGQPAGVAIFFRTFSTWECTPGLWLEDIFVFEQFRRRTQAGAPGVGETLLRHLAALACSRGYARLEWTALDWNEPALAFYRKHGAQKLDAWTTHRLAGDALAAVARHCELQAGATSADQSCG